MTRRFCRPLFSILVTTIGPISAVFRTWVPPQGCRSTPGNFHHAHAAHAGRRLDRHRADSSGWAASSSSVIQRGPTGCASAISALSRRAIASLSRLDPGHVEIEPPSAVGDLAAGHRPRHDRAQQMQTGVHAHQPMPPLPVDLGDEFGAGLGQRSARLPGHGSPRRGASPLSVSMIAIVSPEASRSTPVSPGCPPPVG